MAISTYLELQSAAANWLNRGSLSDRIPEFIALALVGPCIYRPPGPPERFITVRHDVDPNEDFRIVITHVGEPDKHLAFADKLPAKARIRHERQHKHRPRNARQKPPTPPKPSRPSVTMNSPPPVQSNQFFFSSPHDFKYCK